MNKSNKINDFPTRHRFLPMAALHRAGGTRPVQPKGCLSIIAHSGNNAVVACGYRASTRTACVISPFSALAGFRGCNPRFYIAREPAGPLHLPAGSRIAATHSVRLSVGVLASCRRNQPCITVAGQTVRRNNLTIAEQSCSGLTRAPFITSGGFAPSAKSSARSGRLNQRFTSRKRKGAASDRRNTRSMAASRPPRPFTPSMAKCSTDLGAAICCCVPRSVPHSHGVPSHERS